MALKPARLQWSGTGTLESLDYGDVYFQRERGFAESDYVFLQRNRLPERFADAKSAFRIAELGFGSGLNFLLTARLWRKAAPEGARLYYASIEKHPIEKADLARIHAAWPELREFSAPLLEQYPPMVGGFHHIHLPGIHLALLFGDVSDILPRMTGAFDAWYLDGFTPSKNPDMWGEGLYPLIAARTKRGGTLSTFSSAGAVRRGLAAAGFTVQREKGFSFKYHMTTATMESGMSPKEPPAQATVLGAGIAGCSAARALAEKGVKVTVIDRQKGPAQETSGNPFGILYPKLTAAPSNMGAFYSHGFCFTRAWLEALKLPSWNPCGVLMLDLGEEEAARSKKLVESNEYPEDFARAVARAGDVAGIAAEQSALFHASAGYLSPPEFCAALLDHGNIETVYSSAVSRPDPSVPTVLALGMAGRDIVPDLPLQSLRGQISFVEATESSKSLKTVLCHEGFATPAIGGLHYAGATFQKEDPAPPELREADHAENLEKLRRHVPALDISNIRGGRAGYRATTPDKLPLIGALTGPGLYISAGFGAHGLSGAPLAGEIVASLMTGDPAPVPQDLLPALAPERFRLRAERKGRK